MPRLQKRKKRKEVKVVHLSQIKGYWSHFFIICALLLGIWLLLSPYADTNPKWNELAGMSYTPSPLDNVHGIAGVPMRRWVIETKKEQIEKSEFLVNGMDQPTMFLRPGQTIRLEIINTGSVGVYNLAISGYKLFIISLDGKIPGQIIEEESISLLPGKRAQILLTPTWYGTHPVTLYYHSQGIVKNVQTKLLTIQVQGIPMLPSPLPIKLTK